MEPREDWQQATLNNQDASQMISVLRAEAISWQLKYKELEAKYINDEKKSRFEIERDLYKLVYEDLRDAILMLYKKP
jgi:hypothetical protein